MKIPVVAAAVLMVLVVSIMPLAAQGISIHLREAPLSNVLDTVARWANVEFVIAPELTRGTVNINLDNPTLVQALDAIFQPIGLLYKIEGNRIVVNRP